jgi:hypothetical protein
MIDSYHLKTWKKFGFADFSSLMSALEEMYGPRGRGWRCAGRAGFARGLQALADRRQRSGSRFCHWAPSSSWACLWRTGVFNQFSDQVGRVEGRSLFVPH